MFTPHSRHCAAAFFLDFALTVGLAALPFYVFDHVHGGARLSGTIGGLQSASYALTCIASAGFVSRARHGLSWAVIGSALFGVLLPLGVIIPNPYWLGFCCIAAMSGMALFWPAMQSWIGAEPDPMIRSRHISHYNISWTVGLALGALVGGKLYDMHYLLPFAMVAITSFLAALLVASLPHESALHERSDTDVGHPADPEGEALLYATWGANMVSWGLIGVVRTVFPKRVADVVHSGNLTMLSDWREPTWLLSREAMVFAVLALVLYLVQGFCSLWLGRTTFWKYRFWMLAATQLIAAAAFHVLGVTNSLLIMAICNALVGVNAALCFFASVTYSIANPAKKHGRAAIHESMVGFGGCIGATVFGELAQRYGSHWPFLYTPLMVLAAIALQFCLLRYGRKRSAVLRG